MIENLDDDIFQPLTEEEAEAVIAGGPPTKGVDSGYDHTPSGSDAHVDSHIDFS